MKKKAIIIANQDPLLTGVSKDIDHIQVFLKDIVGGHGTQMKLRFILILR